MKTSIYVLGYFDSVKFTVFIVYLMWLVSVCKFLLIENSDLCYCPGSVVRYECIVLGGDGGSTLWRGGGFHCHGGSGTTITLLHNRFFLPNGTSQSCNDGAVVGRSVKVENDTTGLLKYTSQLDVESAYVSNSKVSWIECAYDNDTNEHVVGSLNITADAVLCTVPTNISWVVDCVALNLFVNWNLFVLDCHGQTYNITTLTTNCGSCPTTTVLNNMTCTNAEANGSVCMFSVQAIFDENYSSDPQWFSIQPKCDMVFTKDESGTVKITSEYQILIAVLLVVSVATTTTVITTAVIFKKRPKALRFISRCSQNSSNTSITQKMLRKLSSKQSDTHEFEKEQCIDRDSATVKIFDNTRNGIYGLEDEEYPQTEIQQRMLDFETLLLNLHDQVTSVHWYQFGLALGVPEEYLKQLEAEYSEKDALIELVDSWLKSHPGQPSWQEVNAALDKITADQHH